MSDRSRRLDEYLDHILNAIDKIKRYTGGMGKAAFPTDDLVQDGGIRTFGIVVASHYPPATP